MMAFPRGSPVWLAAGLAAVSIGLAATPLPRRFAGDSGLPPPPAATSESPAGTEVPIDPILALAPFGRTVGADASPSGETPLGLTLHGVVIAGQGQASRAILSGPAGPARAYAVGAEVAPGTILAAAEADRVTLATGDRRETLGFPQRRAAEATAAEPESGVDALRALVTGSEDEDEDVSDPVPAPAATEPTPEDAVAGYRNRIRDDPQALLDDLGVVATDAGYEVAEDASDTLLRIGLEPGDLVVMVNGQQVGNIDQDRDLFDEVTATDRARVEVARDGQAVVLTLPIR